MHQYTKSLLFLLSFVIVSTSFQSCGKYAKQLAWHESELARAANSNMPANEKLDILMNSFVTMTEESLKPINPKKGIKYIQKYNTANKQNIDKILNDVNAWNQSMGEIETLAAGVSLIRKPYAKKAIDLIPKFRRKYKQYKIAMNLANSVTGGLKGFGGKFLKGL